MRTFDEIEQERERNIEADGYTPDLPCPACDGEGFIFHPLNEFPAKPCPSCTPEVAPTGDGLHGRYCVVAVYHDTAGERRKVISRWKTSTMAERIARIVARYNEGRFAFIGVLDEVESRWVAKLEDEA